MGSFDGFPFAKRLDEQLCQIKGLNFLFFDWKLLHVFLTTGNQIAQEI